MYSLILILPFLSFLLSGFTGFYFGREISTYLSVFCIFLTFLFVSFVFYEVGLSDSITIVPLYTWTSIELFSIKIGLLFDSLSVSMLIIITSISFFVHLYSLGYMSHDPHLSRFISYLSLFTFFMIILVTSDNFIQLFVGWEGVGLCSFLLINFWYTRILANKAALKAMIMNRIADVFFILGILLIFITFKTVDYVTIFNNIDLLYVYSISFANFEIPIADFISFFLLVGGIGKSAQLGLHTWLPAAMEGPSPVSALLHAATMVTAGVFLIIRCSFIFEESANILFLVALIGVFTAFFSAFIGVFQYDVKKVIAYSTCSQLGYMFFSCGLSNYQVAIFHLINHAFFKALLFLSAGAIIHALADEQDMRRMGGMVNFLPFTYFALVVGSLAIMGFPFLTGFYSKDLVLELAFARYVIDSAFVHLLGVLAAFFTAVYSIRLLLFALFLRTNIFKSVFSAHESSFVMSVSMFCLVIFSIFWGYITSDLFVGWGTYFWDTSIYVLPSNFMYIETEFISPLIKNLPLIVSLCGSFIAFFFIFFYKLILNKYSTVSVSNFLIFIWNKCSAFFFNAGFFDLVYNSYFFKIYKFSYISTNKYIDKGLLEWFGPYGAYIFVRKWSLWIKTFTPSILFFTIGFMFFALFCLYIFILWSLPFFSTLTINGDLFVILILLWLLIV